MFLRAYDLHGTRRAIREEVLFSNLRYCLSLTINRGVNVSTRSDRPYCSVNVDSSEQERLDVMELECASFTRRRRIATRHSMPPPASCSYDDKCRGICP